MLCITSSTAAIERSESKESECSCLLDTIRPWSKPRVGYSHPQPVYMTEHVRTQLFDCAQLNSRELAACSPSGQRLFGSRRRYCCSTENVGWAEAAAAKTAAAGALLLEV